MLFLTGCVILWSMKKSWLIIGIVILVLALVGLVVKTKVLDRKNPAALQISTTPKAIVFIDGTQVGTTPFLDDKIEPGEHQVKLVPETTDENLVTWEGRVDLTQGIMVVINRVLGTKESDSSGEILTLEKISSRDKSSLAVVSMPDQAVVKIDGEPKGFAPILIEDLTPNDYQVVVSSPGYQEKTISAKTIAGYKLIANVQLAKEIEGIEEATPSAEEEENEESEETTPTPEAKATPTPKVKTSPTPEPEKPYVRIKDTSTGWLRVREGPSTGDTELAKVEPDETFPYLGETTNGWHKIEYEKDKEGWISGVYAELVEE